MAKNERTVKTELTARNAGRKQQVALMRLQLRFTAETHQMYRRFFDDLVRMVNEAVDDEGFVGVVGLSGALPQIERAWGELHSRWATMLAAARQQAANLPMGALVVTHNSLVTGLQEALTAQEEALARMWEMRRQRALDATAQRVYGDGFNLSGRIWRLEQGGLDDIRRTLSTAYTERTSATRLAKLIEPLLGAGQNCPRWAYRRLYDMTPGDRAANGTGLMSGDDCGSKGLAYNALRLARNEIQIAHHAVNDELLKVAPWVEGESIVLSPGHAEVDICDEYAAGGPYQPGEVQLPLHVQCMCWKKAQVMPAGQFRDQAQAWVRGENGFLDEYSNWLGQSPIGPLPAILATSLQDWLESNLDVHGAALGVER